MVNSPQLTQKAVQLLAMREYSKQELEQKLSRYSDDPALVGEVVQIMIAKDYVSDTRFSESYVRYRKAKGFGPVKIIAELRQKGVKDTLINEHVQLNHEQWYARAQEQYSKKFGKTPYIFSKKEWSRRARFLVSRGYQNHHIYAVLPDIEDTVAD